MTYMKTKINSSGFTLVELMVAVAISAVLLVVAVPNMTSLIQSSRLSSQTDALITSISQARSEAVKRRADVTICPAQSPSTATVCAPAVNVSDIAAAKTYWSKGWLILTGTTIIDRVVASSNLSIDSTLAPTQLVFSGTLGSSSAAASFKFCSPGQYQQQVDVNLSGSVGKFINTALKCS